MKKLLIAFSMIGAVALVACATDNSVKPTYAEESWFGAKVTNGQIDLDRGEFVRGTDSTFEVSGDKIEIDSELSDPVKFVLNDSTASLTTQLARVTFELDLAVVPYSARPTATELKNLDGVKIAFAFCEEDSGIATNFYVWTGGDDWNKLDFAIPTDTFMLTVNFDEAASEAKKVQFSMGTATSGWYDYTPSLAKPRIDFVGSGMIKELAAVQLKLVEAEIDFNGQSVKIAGEDMDAMNALKGSGETIEQVLAATAKDKVNGIDSKCGLTVAEAYAIGLIAKEGDKMAAKADGTFKVKADATATTTAGIKVGFVTPLTPNDSNATITYGLKGSKTGADTDWVEFDDVTANDSASIVIPTEKVTAGYRYFKVVTKVDLSK